MPQPIYLDTARLGPMTPAARHAHLDFVRLATEEPSSLYFETFLRHGYSAWPLEYQSRFPALQIWPGVAGLKRSIAQLVQAPEHWRVSLASRSRALLDVAAHCQYRICRHVLSTDLAWQPYLEIIAKMAKQTQNRLTVIPLRERILREGWNAAEIVEYMTQEYHCLECDGLFLPAIDHLGIQLPLAPIVRRIREHSELRFCLVDAAQAFCHVPLNDVVEVADYIVAGTHKWMGAYLPMSLGLYGHSRSREMIEHITADLIETDPLMEFMAQIEGQNPTGGSETVNLSPLFACAGAVSDQSANRASSNPSDSQMTTLSPAIHGHWRPLEVAAGLRTRIILYEPRQRSQLKTSGDAVRATWLEAGYIVSGYADGLARVSVPF